MEDCGAKDSHPTKKPWSPFELLDLSQFSDLDSMPEESDLQHNKYIP